MTEEELAAALTEFIEEPAPPVPDTPSHDAGTWHPDLNPTQRVIFDDPTENILFDSEKGTGKSIIGCHKLVRHCYEVENALAYIIVTTYNTGDMGIWYDLEQLVLPAWRDGNRYPEFYITADGRHLPHPQAGELKDTGIGLEFTPTKLDPKTKASKIYIRNRFGTWSLVVLLSVPYGVLVESRMKGPAPSYIYLEELTNCDSRKYYSFPSAQLGRRRGLRGAPQQFTASCNPAGPSHWVYKLFFEECAVAADQPGRDWPDGIRRNPRFARYHVPLSENHHRLPPGYVNRLMDSFKDDPVQIARLVEGLWVDMPTGDAIFKGHFSPVAHVRGDIKTHQGIQPQKGFTITIGYDPGPVNFSVSFEQIIPTKQGIIWTIFDEINCVGRYMPYDLVVPMIMRRMAYWCSNPAGGGNHPFFFEHIGPADAFNQVRGDGSFDARRIEELSLQWVQKTSSPLRPIKMRECPQGNETVPARVRCVIELLDTESLLVSATCPKHIEMFNLLESEPVKEGKWDPVAHLRPKRSPYLHPFDSCSYPIFFYNGVGGRSAVKTGTVIPQVYEAR